MTRHRGLRALVAGLSLATAATAFSTAGTASAATRSGPIPAQPRTAIPWSHVGPGWFVAVEDSATCDPCDEAGPKKLGAGTASLLVVSPTGARYRDLTWPVNLELQGFDLGLGELAGWSGDGRRVVLTNARGSKTTEITVVDLVHGTTHGFSVAGLDAVAFTRPAGDQLLVTHQVGAAHPVAVVDRYSLAGTRVARLGAGASDPVERPDGTVLAAATAKGIALVANNGTTLRTVRVPGQNCTPVRWWDSRKVLVRCGAVHRFAQDALALLDTTTGHASPLLPAPNYQEDLGDLDAWQLPSGTYTQSLGGCGVIDVVRHRGTQATVVPMPSGYGDTVIVLDVAGAGLAVRASGGCAGGGVLALWNPATGSARTLLRGAPHTSGVESALAYPRPTAVDFADQT